MAEHTSIAARTGRKNHALRHSSGAASIELAVAAPVIALFIVVIVQLSSVFTQSINDLATADAAASEAVAEWDASGYGRGFGRPCLEMMPVRLFRSGGNPLPAGAGAWRRFVGVPQEVHVVAGDICKD